MGFNNRSIVVCFAFSALHERYYIFALVLSDTSALPWVGHFRLTLEICLNMGLYHGNIDFLEHWER